MRKIILLSLIIFVTIGLVYALVFYIGVEGFLFAWVLNFVLMMCVLTFTETLKSNFVSNYYKEKVWERRGKIYEKLGINLFRKLLVLVGWEKLNKKANPVKNNIEALTHLEYRTKQSELGHIIIFFIVLCFAIYVTIVFSFTESLWLLFLNVILNVYPILLQRYNRPRLQRALELIKHKQGRLHNS
ncbi:glycosyl-4,4'-diaponeurosporenoate acyltransferase CrtO family protein [Flavobacterium sp. HNIBRBA15423]|uniref:glycosyl-4,4'-diaponeurosporenoate acyltransferase CrtO family protein n=1 Tax=Flavobacterium sp. HNIBRBA15423 TaxID=3458683 RepID=UPI0040450814